MNGTVSIDKFGRVVIPKEFRDKAGTNTFAPSWTPKGLLFQPVMEKPRRLVRIKGRLVAQATGDSFDGGKLIREERERE
ncbi:MAG: hypothetical protein H7X97_09790 [Opitutaceae bacterium]|nr:hypothetical protein [Verrucomicrobiales bacterium]